MSVYDDMGTDRLEGHMGDDRSYSPSVGVSTACTHTHTYEHQIGLQTTHTKLKPIYYVRPQNGSTVRQKD